MAGLTPLEDDVLVGAGTPSDRSFCWEGAGAVHLRLGNALGVLGCPMIFEGCVAVGVGGVRVENSDSTVVDTFESREA